MTFTMTALKNLSILGFSAFTLGFAWLTAVAGENDAMEVSFLIEAECPAEDALDASKKLDI